MPTSLLGQFQAGPLDFEAISAKSEITRRRALIVIGLAGDEEHQRRFEQTCQLFRVWLTEVAGVKPSDITIIGGRDAIEQQRAATGETIRSVTRRLMTELGSDQALWVFLIGHGSQDDRHGWFHLPGPDLNAAEWASLFADLKAGEQVFWLTHSASGRFVKPFSLPGRIVIAATDDGEVNETRFPGALADVMQRHLHRDTQDRNTNEAGGNETNASDSGRNETDTSERDTEGDVDAPASVSASASPARPLTVLELFRAAAEQVQRSFDENNLIPTEHARLDDNGDGVGTELADLPATNPSTEAAAAAKTIDGLLSGRTIAGTTTRSPASPSPTDETPPGN